MEVRGRRNRETTTTTSAATSPERMKVYVQPKMKPFKKVQILYYLCRNGQLEHPHFMEVSHLANQQLRLKDVIDRLIVLRGKNMPSLFSWSCKRSYKNGYVWNDLSEHDVIYPAEGAEYVLKGSELIEGCAERFQQLQVVSKNQQNPEPNFQPKSKLPQNRVLYMRGEEEEEDEVVEEEEEEDEEEEEKESNSRCSRGVSTDEDLKNPTEISLEDASPPSTSSTISEKTHGNAQGFDDGGEPILMTRSSSLFQLITCGSSVIMKERSNAATASSSSTMKYCFNSNGRKSSSSSSLHKGVLCKTAINKMMSEEDEINYMSENPRFGNPQSEEKEYFSGSIVESMTEERVATEPTLKKSSSYNEDRSNKSRMGDEATLVPVPVEEKAATTDQAAMKKSSNNSNSSSSCISMKGKCLPRKIKSNHSTTTINKKSGVGGGQE